MKEILSKILEAREKRAFFRQAIVEKNKISISFNLNIPGFPKCNDLINKFFIIILKELKIWLSANRIFFEEYKNTIDEAGNFWICFIKNENISSQFVKETTEKFENKHDIGRIIDIDVSDEKGNLISSEKLKKCFICSSPAIICMKENKHSKEDLRKFIFEKVKLYLSKKRKEEITKKIAAISIKSLLYEVSLTPKPGLVDFNSSGSHSDMNYYTFLNSISSLSPYIQEIAAAGYSFNDDFSKALPIIRNFGLQMEKTMFQATNNINTQKGLIFLLGISVFVSGIVLSKDDFLDFQKFIEYTKQICKNITKNELEKNLQKSTHGEKVFEKYGKFAGGARLEAEMGFPTVFNFGLPILQQYFNECRDKNHLSRVLQKTLVSIMSENNDTNILYRTDKHVLIQLKNYAKKVLNEELSYKEICDFCKKENISPGGSADLLVISLFLFFLKD